MTYESLMNNCNIYIYIYISVCYFPICLIVLLLIPSYLKKKKFKQCFPNQTSEQQLAEVSLT